MSGSSLDWHTRILVLSAMSCAAHLSNARSVIPCFAGTAARRCGSYRRSGSKCPSMRTAEAWRFYLWKG